MSPSKTAGNDIFANGLRERVAACRKRLRNNRIFRDGQFNTEQDEVFPETVSEPELHADSASYIETRMSAGLVDYAALGFESMQPRDGESLLLVGEQEVGIT